MAVPGLLRRIVLRLHHPLRAGFMHDGVVFQQDVRGTALLAAVFLLIGATCDIWYPVWGAPGVGVVAVVVLLASVLFVYPEQESWRFTRKRQILWSCLSLVAAALIAALLRSA